MSHVLGEAGMATITRARTAPEPAHGYNNQTYDDNTDEDTEDAMDESRDPLEESGCTHSDESEDEMDEAVAEDINNFERTFQGINKRYRLINRIGEGTFSTVYKAEDLEYDKFRNDWDVEAKENQDPYGTSKRQTEPRSRYVAIKKIYVTSSPVRIFNELALLHDLRGSTNVSPLITAFRHHDQVVAILPYFQHKDFRDYFREMSVADMRPYFHSLFTAVQAVHEAHIVHRDIKPTNFLYSPSTRRGVLVDFGLAEREGTDWAMCHCQLRGDERKRRIESSIFWSVKNQYAAAGKHHLPEPQYPREDQRHGRRANRAGTRGFRAPEVLLKCTAQGCLIDVWSCGVILLTFLSRRFPFFHSTDDVDAFIELASIFGRKRMNDVALRHGQALQTNIPSLTENGFSWHKILSWCLGRKKAAEFSEDEDEAIQFMDACLALDPDRRITARSALTHPFITKGMERAGQPVDISSSQDTDMA